jgi:hypothetical protein
MRHDVYLVQRIWRDVSQLEIPVDDLDEAKEIAKLMAKKAGGLDFIKTELKECRDEVEKMVWTPDDNGDIVHKKLKVLCDLLDQFQTDPDGEFQNFGITNFK